jgi:hypothetical protein
LFLPLPLLVSEIGPEDGRDEEFGDDRALEERPALVSNRCERVGLKFEAH